MGNTLPTDVKALREAVRKRAYTLLDHSANRDEFARVVEIIAVEARAAGVRAALGLVRDSQQEPAPGTKIFQSSPMTLYVDGYRHAVGDVMEILSAEIVGD